MMSCKLMYGIYSQQLLKGSLKLKLHDKPGGQEPSASLQYILGSSSSAASKSSLPIIILAITT